MKQQMQPALLNNRGFRDYFWSIKILKAAEFERPMGYCDLPIPPSQLSLSKQKPGTPICTEQIVCFYAE